MRVMTFNLRFDTPVDGVNQWVYRKELVVEAILAHRPDLLATQEGTVPQLEFLAANLPGYLPLIGHREVDPTCQYPTIFYRADGFEVQDSGEFWLSETPLVHRSLSWGSAFPRMLTYGRFKERPRPEWFYFADTHLDHISGEARFKGAQMIREFFSPRPEPLILAGDFNEPPDSPVYQEFSGRLPLLDTWRAFHPPGEEATTQHSFDGRPRGARIDWILAAPVFRVAKASILDYHQGERYPSDHFPYLVELEY
jgi:endonuclease/exonuclease/phosphatase family metal-dependent hydrolase